MQQPGAVGTMPSQHYHAGELADCLFSWALLDNEAGAISRADGRLQGTPWLSAVGP